jgi:hypothetical protein
MATTIRYRLGCPACGDISEVDADELDNDPCCNRCGEPLGTVVRIEGFEREPKRVG